MEELFNMIANLWDGGLSGMYESSLTTDMIEDSVSRACEFFNIDEPLDIRPGEMTGVGLGNMESYNDDILFYNPSQLADMGITGQDGLDLVMTHEGTHRMLQDMDTGFNTYQEELCSDYMAGVRAGLNGMDVSQLENSLIDTPQGLEHPVGTLRVDAIEQGMAFAQEYMASHTLPPTFNECLEDFKGEYMQDVASLAELKNEVYVCECTMEHYHRLMEHEPDNDLAKHHYLESEANLARYQSEYENKLSHLEALKNKHPEENNVSFKGHDKELSSYAKSKIKHNTDLADKAFEEEKYCYKKAEEASFRGDEKLAKQYLQSAKKWHETAEGYLRSVKVWNG